MAYWLPPIKQNLHHWKLIDTYEILKIPSAPLCFCMSSNPESQTLLRVSICHHTRHLKGSGVLCSDSYRTCVQMRVQTKCSQRSTVFLRVIIPDVSKAPVFSVCLLLDLCSSSAFSNNLICINVTWGCTCAESTPWWDLCRSEVLLREKEDLFYVRSYVQSLHKSSAQNLYSETKKTSFKREAMWEALYNLCTKALQKLYSGRRKASVMWKALHHQRWSFWSNVSWVLFLRCEEREEETSIQ